MDLPELPDAVPEERTSLWTTTATLRGGGGYKDNPQMSVLNPEASGFVSGAGDFTLLRVPLDGHEISVFGTFDYVEYFEGTLEPESLGLLDLRWQRTLGGGWSAGALVDYVFLHQVFDASEIEGTPFVVRAEGHTLTVRPNVSWSWSPAWKLDLEMEAGRQWLAEPLDGFWDATPRLTLLRRWDTGTEASISYRYRDRLFDSRSPTDAEGVTLPGRLRFMQHELEVVGRRTWGSKREWRATVRAGWLRSSDSGVGYLDYDRVQAGAVLRWVRKAVEVRAEVRSRWYWYPVQRTEGLSGDARRRWDLTSSMRVEWKLRDFLTWYGQYERELTDENVVSGDYHVNTVSSGVAWEF